MGKLIAGSLRLAVGLVCVGVSLILGAHWVGFIPDATPVKMRARKTLCETVAINCAAHVRKQQWVDLATTLETQADRNPQILSIGIRTELGNLRVDSGHHAELWPESGSPNHRVDAVHIPITLNRRPWGRVEFCFQRPESSFVTQVAQHPFAQLIVFFSVFGLVGYTAYMARILKVFHDTQVVPDRVRQALDTLAEGLLVLDEKGKIVLANQAFAELVDQASDGLVGQIASDLEWVIGDAPMDVFPWTLAIELSEIQTERILQFQLPDGTHRIYSVNAAPLGQSGSQRGALATFRDVTHVEEHRAELERMLSLLKGSRDEIKRKNRELEILATQDALTGCLNRRAFFESFESLWNESHVLKTPLSCLMFDIDHFKSVNDTYGHHIGDEVLRRVSTVIRRLFHEKGLVCRYGGEEFCVVLPHVDLADAIVAAETTRAAVTKIRLLDPAKLRLTASIGVSELRFTPENMQDLVNQADACLYVAKREGRNRVIAYNIAMEDGDATREDPTEKIEIPFQAVTALVTALSYRDPNTVEHSRRVADLCSRASEGLFDPGEQYLLEISALLHDIGKIGIPDEILHWPGELTPEQWDIMRRHSRIAKEIMTVTFGCERLSEIAACRYARYDGSHSDPSLPSGHEIPAAARMLAIADAYDAMTSRRAYRKECSHEEAITELRRCSGTQFDPRMVEHFVEKVDPSRSVVTSGALAAQKRTALEIGESIEQFANAVASQDFQAVSDLSDHLCKLANSIKSKELATAAKRISGLTRNEDAEWVAILRETYDMMDLCRSAQASYLQAMLEAEAAQVNRSSGH